MGYNFLSYDRDQLYLLPPALQDWPPRERPGLVSSGCRGADGFEEADANLSERWLGAGGVRSHHDGGTALVCLLCGRTIKSAP